LLAQNHFPAAESHNKCSPSSKICCAVYRCLMCSLDSSCMAPSYKTCSVSYLNASLTIHECCAGALWSAFQMVLRSWLWLKLHGVLLDMLLFLRYSLIAAWLSVLPTLECIHLISVLKLQWFIAILCCHFRPWSYILWRGCIHMTHHRTNIPSKSVISLEILICVHLSC
jgi:hypothetical protein